MRVVAGAYALNYAVKVTVRRPRPELAGPAAADAHGLTAVVPQRPRHHLVCRRRAPTPDWLPRPRCTAAAIAFAVSRPYLGVHYPSDVAGRRGAGDVGRVAAGQVGTTACR